MGCVCYFRYFSRLNSHIKTLYPLAQAINFFQFSFTANFISWMQKLATFVFPKTNPQMALKAPQLCFFPKLLQAQDYPTLPFFCPPLMTEGQNSCLSLHSLHSCSKFQERFDSEFWGFVNRWGWWRWSKKMQAQMAEVGIDRTQGKWNEHVAVLWYQNESNQRELNPLLQYCCSIPNWFCWVGRSGIFVLLLGFQFVNKITNLDAPSTLCHSLFSQ